MQNEKVFYSTFIILDSSLALSTLMFLSLAVIMMWWGERR